MWKTHNFILYFTLLFIQWLYHSIAEDSYETSAPKAFLKDMSEKTLKNLPSLAVLAFLKQILVLSFF